MISVNQFLDEVKVIYEEAAVEQFGSVEAFIIAYNKDVDAENQETV